MTPLESRTHSLCPEASAVTPTGWATVCEVANEPVGLPLASYPKTAPAVPSATRNFGAWGSKMAVEATDGSSGGGSTGAADISRRTSRHSKAGQRDADRKGEERREDRERRPERPRNGFQIMVATFKVQAKSR